MNFFDKANEIIRDLEGSIVNLISSIAPWFAPLPAAVMSYMHMTDVLLFPWWVAWAVAITIEILGFSTISTWLDFWSWNRRFSSDKSLKKAPLSFVIISFGFYLGIVVSMNVLLDLSNSFPNLLDPKWSVIMVRSLLTLMTIPAGLIIATRVQHHDLLDEIRKQKEERKGAKIQKPVETYTKVSTSWRTTKKTMSKDTIEFIASSNINLIMDKFGVEERTAYNWQKYAREELHGVINEQ